MLAVKLAWSVDDNGDVTLGTWSRNGTSDLALKAKVQRPWISTFWRGEVLRFVHQKMKAIGEAELWDVLWMFFGGKSPSMLMFEMMLKCNVDVMCYHVDDFVVLLCIGMYCGVVEDAWGS